MDASSLFPEEFQVSVPAAALEVVLAFLGEEEFGERLDDDEQLRMAFDLVSDCLHHFAESCPEFDDRPC